MSLSKKTFFGGKRKFFQKNGDKKKKRREIPDNGNNKNHKVRHDTDLMVCISEVSFKIRKIARFYDLDHTTTTTLTITTGYLKKITGWLAILNPGGKRLKPIEEIS